MLATYGNGFEPCLLEVMVSFGNGWILDEVLGVGPTWETGLVPYFDMTLSRARMILVMFQL